MDTLDIDACATLAQRLRVNGVETTMHADYLRSEAQERTLGPDASTDNVQRKLGALKVALFIVSTWPWEMQAEYILGQILAELDRVTTAWSTSTLPNYPTESMIAASRKQAADCLDLHHVRLLSLLDQRHDTEELELAAARSPATSPTTRTPTSSCAPGRPGSVLTAPGRRPRMPSEPRGAPSRPPSAICTCCP
ncbi:hypothetical protein ACIOHR_29610 [Streptomyces anulatus]